MSILARRRFGSRVSPYGPAVPQAAGWPRLAAVAAISALGLSIGGAGCASDRSGGPSRTIPNLTCNSAERCRVHVEVHCATTPCTMTVDQEGVDPNGFAVVWDIVEKPGQSYRFANPGGIGFKDAYGEEAFDCGSEAASARYRCKARTRDGRRYNYRIQLVGSPEVSPLDPWIVNR